MTVAPNIAIKRVYDPPAAGDGLRILVDRLWPRGLARAKAGIDLWLKDIAPSTELRLDFGHDPVRWPAFVAAYRKELATNPEPLDRLLGLCNARSITLLFAAHDIVHNNAVVLADVLTEHRRKGS